MISSKAVNWQPLQVPHPLGQLELELRHQQREHGSVAHLGQALADTGARAVPKRQEAPEQWLLRSVCLSVRCAILMSAGKT